MPDAVWFRAMTRADLPLLRPWLEQPHVREWWADPATELASLTANLDEPDMEQFILFFGDRPMGYLQHYDPKAWPHVFGLLPAGARGLDMLVGEPDLVGVGLGSRALKRFVDGLFASGCPQVVIDPDPANGRAVAAYGKAGFIPYGAHDAPPWGPALLMKRSAG